MYKPFRSPQLSALTQFESFILWRSIFFIDKRMFLWFGLLASTSMGKRYTKHQWKPYKSFSAWIKLVNFRSAHNDTNNMKASYHPVPQTTAKVSPNTRLECLSNLNIPTLKNLRSIKIMFAYLLGIRYPVEKTICNNPAHSIVHETK